MIEVKTPHDYRRLVQEGLNKRLKKKPGEEIDLAELWKNHGGDPNFQNWLPGQLFSKLFEDPFDDEDRGYPKETIEASKRNALRHVNWLVREIAKQVLKSTKPSIIKTENQPSNSEVPNEATVTNQLPAPATE